jgi:hypothetical protein
MIAMCFAQIIIDERVVQFCGLVLIGSLGRRRGELDAVNSFFPDRVVPRFDILEFVQNRKERGAQLRVGSAAPNLPRNSDHQ